MQAWKQGGACMLLLLLLLLLLLSADPTLGRQAQHEPVHIQPRAHLLQRASGL